MNNRIWVVSPTDGMSVVGMATVEAGMVVKFHGQTGGSGDEYGDRSNTDYYTVTAVANDIVTATSQTSSLTRTEYAHATYVKSNDVTLNDGDNWPDDTNHFPY